MAQARRSAGADSSPRPLRILFVALTNDLGMDRLPGAFAMFGAECAVLAPQGFIGVSSHAMRRWFRLPSHRGLWLGIPFLKPRLEAACREWDAELVVPIDDVAGRCLRALATSKLASPRLRTLLERSLGDPQGYAAACSRSGLMRLAARLGVRVPRFCISHDPNAWAQRAAEWGYPVVIKDEYTCGGHGVTIATTPDVLAASAKEPSEWQRARRALRNKVWRLAHQPDAAAAPPVLQAFVRGFPAMRTVSTWRGEVLDGISFVAEKTDPGPTGPSTFVRHVVNPEMEDTVRRVVYALGCSGFVSFDFMLDEETGEASLIEMNPRPIGTSHLGRLFGHDLCAALLARFGRHAELPPAQLSLSAHSVALFPKEIERDCDNLDRLFAPGVHHDIPLGEPAMMALYLRRLKSICTKQQFVSITESLHRMDASVQPARLRSWSAAAYWPLRRRPRHAAIRAGVEVQGPRQPDEAGRLSGVQPLAESGAAMGPRDLPSAPTPSFAPTHASTSVRMAARL